MDRPQATTTEAEVVREEGRPRASARDARERLLEGLPVSERRLRLGGMSTAVLKGGHGPPLVLLHGPGGYAAQWFRVIPALVETNTVIAPDLPGHGTSEAPDDPVDADDILDWLDALIENTCSEPPVLVGHLVGGAIAARFAIRSGERLKQLVLVDTFGLAPFQPKPEFGAALNEFASNPTGETHDRFWDRCAFNLDALRTRMGDRWEDLKQYNLDRARAIDFGTTPQGLMKEFGMEAIPQAELAQIEVPTHLVWGRHDLATPLHVAQDASSRFGWPLSVIENAADDPPVEQPEALVEALRSNVDNNGGGTESGDLSETQAAWDTIAVGYDETNTPTQMWIGRESLLRAGLREGMRFLDVAAGSGAMSIPAARLGADVVAIDLSPVMLDLLNARAGAEGLHVETRVMDGHALEFDDNRFDVVGSQFGVMLFPNMPKAIREMVRVVKRGGRVLVNAYGDPHKVEFLGFLIEAVQSVRPDFTGPPMDPPPLEFQLADPDRLRRELSKAGLNDVWVETVTETTTYEDGHALWDWITTSNPIVDTILGSLDLSDDERGTVKEALNVMIRERRGDNSAAKLTNPVNIGVGTK